MFEEEQRAAEARIREFCASRNILLGDLKWSPIPFAGEWGISTSFFAIAA